MWLVLILYDRDPTTKNLLSTAMIYGRCLPVGYSRGVSTSISLFSWFNNLVYVWGLRKGVSLCILWCLHMMMYGSTEQCGLTLTSEVWGIPASHLTYSDGIIGVLWSVANIASMSSNTAHPEPVCEGNISIGNSQISTACSKQIYSSQIEHNVIEYHNTQ